MIFFFGSSIIKINKKFFENSLFNATKFKYNYFKMDLLDNDSMV